MREKERKKRFSESERETENTIDSKCKGEKQKRIEGKIKAENAKR